MKKKMGKYAAVLTALALMMVSFAGCVRMDVSITVKKNGKVDFRFLYAMMNFTGEEPDEDEFDAGEWKDKGYDVQLYNEDNYIGMLVTAEDMDPAKLSEKNGGMGDFAEGDIIKREGSTFILDMDVWNSDGMDDLLPYIGDLSNYDGYMRLTLSTPVKAKNHNATSVSDDGHTLTWDLTKMKGEKIHAEFNLGGALWIIICIAVLVVGILIFVGLFFWSRRKAKLYRNEWQEPVEVSETAGEITGEVAGEAADGAVPEETLPEKEVFEGTEPEKTE